MDSGKMRRGQRFWLYAWDGLFKRWQFSRSMSLSEFKKFCRGYLSGYDQDRDYFVTTMDPATPPD